MKVNIGPYLDTENGKRVVDIKIDDYDIWSLDHTLALIIHPCLIKFKENNNGIPGSIESIEQWNEILDKMIKAFGMIIEECTENNSEIEEGLLLFSEYFQALWD
jgi:hypothetical protein